MFASFLNDVLRQKLTRYKTREDYNKSKWLQRIALNERINYFQSKISSLHSNISDSPKHAKVLLASLVTNTKYEQTKGIWRWIAQLRNPRLGIEWPMWRLLSCLTNRLFLLLLCEELNTLFFWHKNYTWYKLIVFLPFGSSLQWYSTVVYWLVTKTQQLIP